MLVCMVFAFIGGLAGHAVALDFAGEAVIRRADGEKKIDIVAFERGVGDLQLAVLASGGSIDHLVSLIEGQDDQLRFAIAEIPAHAPVPLDDCRNGPQIKIGFFRAVGGFFLRHVHFREAIGMPLHCGG